MDVEERELAVVEVPDRKIRAAYQRRLEGASWVQVAEEFGYSTAGTAQVTISRYLQRTALQLDDTERRSMLTLELERLDALQQAVWQNAMTGDVRSVDAALKVMDRRHKLLRLDEEAERLQEHTLIVSPATMVEQLKQVVLERDGVLPPGSQP